MRRHEHPDTGFSAEYPTRADLDDLPVVVFRHGNLRAVACVLDEADEHPELVLERRTRDAMDSAVWLPVRESDNPVRFLTHALLAYRREDERCAAAFREQAASLARVVNLLAEYGYRHDADGHPSMPPTVDEAVEIIEGLLRESDRPVVNRHREAFAAGWEKRRLFEMQRRGEAASLPDEPLDDDERYEFELGRFEGKGR